MHIHDEAINAGVIVRPQCHPGSSFSTRGRFLQRGNGGIGCEPITVELQDFTLDDQGPRFAIERRLSQSLGQLDFSHDHQTRIKTLCGLLECAGSAVVGTSTTGPETASTALIPCIDAALKAKNRSLELPRLGVRDSLERNDKPTNRLDSERVRPLALIIVAHDIDIDQMLSYLGDLLQQTQISLRCTGIHDVGIPPPRNSKGHYPAIDIAVCSACGANELFERKSTYCLDELKFVLWYNAHLWFGPGFRRTRLLTADYVPTVYKVASKIRLYRKVRFVLLGPVEHLHSLSVIKRAVLATKGETRILEIDESGNHLERSHIESPRRALCGHDPDGTSRALLQQPPTEQTVSYFSRLPGEVRNNIYLHAVTAGSTFKIATFRPAANEKPCRAVLQAFFSPHESIVFDHVQGKWEGEVPSTTFALSRVNKQLAAETLPMYYADSIFEFRSVGCMNVFLRSIGSLRPHLRHIKITGGLAYLYTKPTTVFQSLAPLLGLRHLDIGYGSIVRSRSTQLDNDRLDQFVGDIKGYLASWHDTNKDELGASAVLDFVKLTRTCRKCRAEVDQKSDAVDLNNTTLSEFQLRQRGFCPHKRRPIDVRRLSGLRRDIRWKLAEALGISE